jgi:hypothetical protein
MNNDQNNPRIKGRSIDVNELKKEDYNYRVIHDNGFYYFLCMHKLDWTLQVLYTM